MKTLRRICMLIFSILVLGACQSDELENLAVQNQKQQPYELKVPSTKVTKEDAYNVAIKNISSKGLGIPTRSVRSIDNIQCISDKAGNPSIYVVNFMNEQGFMLISATRNYHPILAYNDKGHFEINCLPEGVSTWIYYIKEDIATANALPKDSTYLFRSEWAKYDKPTPYYVANTRSVKSDFENYVMNMVSNWTRDGIEYHALGESQGIIPEDVYQRWCAIAEGSIFPEYGDYMNYSFILVERCSQNNEKKLEFGPKWGQKRGFNKFFPILSSGERAVAGCGTIAMATVLRQNEYPAYMYPWKDMPYYENTKETANNETADFVRDVAESLNPIYEIGATGTTLSNIKKSFVNKFHYSRSIDIVKHTTERTLTEISGGRYVIMTGYSPQNLGHAWVTSGYEQTAGHTVYKLWVPNTNIETGSPYNVIETYKSDFRDYTNFYFHWGWDGYNDGYFLDSYISADGNSYNKKREDLVNIIPMKD